MYMNSVSHTVIGLLGCSLLGAACAVSADAQTVAPPNVISNVAAPGVTLVPPPPEGYDPLSASAESNARYATPPAPPVSSGKAYAEWKRAVSGPSIHETPTFTQTNIVHGPIQLSGPGAKAQSSNGTASTTSGNWSGSAVLNFANPKNVEAIEQEFVVPTAHQAFGSCTGGWDYSSVWPGIDGYGSSDVLQGGIEADAYCKGSTKSAYYSAWIEWYPNSSTRVSSPAISPGDLLFVEVWNTSPTQGYVYFKDFSTNVTAEYGLVAPSGTKLKGNSVEWIVERPGVGGGLATLTNYIDVTSTSSVAWDYNNTPVTNYFPNVNPAFPATLYFITMTDSAGKGISSATGWTGEAQWFLNFGSSCGLGNTAGNPC